MNLLAQGEEWLHDQRHEHMTSAVTYSRGAEEITINATIGKTERDVFDANGTMMKVMGRDYIVQTADLVLGGEPVEPKRGDQIRETSGSQVHVYEVMSEGNHPAWRHGDRAGKTFRIHTKYVGVEAVS